MPRPVAVVELGMEASADIREVRARRKPLYEAVLGMKDAEARALAQCLEATLWVAGIQARNLTAYLAKAETVAA